MENPIETILRGGKFKKMITNQFADVKEKYGLKRVEVEILYTLSKCGEDNTLKDLAKRLEMNKGHISQAVDRLCKQGYLTADVDVNDRRYIHYLITDKGKEFNEDVSELWEKMLDMIFEGVTEEQMRIFKEVAYKIGENMNRSLDE